MNEVGVVNYYCYCGIGVWGGAKLAPMEQRKGGRKTTRNPAGRAGAPVSLYPLSFKEAVAGLAQVKMPDPAKKPKRNGKARP